MKIAYIAGAGVPSPSANSIHVMRMCEALALIGHDVLLIVPQRSPAHELDAFDYYGVKPVFRIEQVGRLPRKAKTYGFAFAAARLARRFSADLVYCRSLQAAFLAAMLRLPLVLESHSPFRDKGRVAEWMFRAIVSSNALRRLVVITEALASYYEREHPKVAGRLLTAPDGGREVGGQFAEGRIPRKEDRLRVGYLGSLFSGKCMEVIEPVARIWAGADFHVVGGAPAEVADWRMRLGDCEHVHFHGRSLPAHAASYIASFDIALLPNQHKMSYGEKGVDFGQWTSPLKLFEYMAARRPIIASDIPVLREVLRHEENCLLCDPKSPEDWVAALQRLVGDESLRNALGHQAEIDFLGRYTWQKRAQRILYGLSIAG